MIELLNMDCMDYLRELPDSAFELAVVDPPFGIGADNMQMGKGKNKTWKKGASWDSSIPDYDYFSELSRVSSERIIWGGNYFNLSPTGGWIFWDKDRRKDISFSDGELAWTSFLNVLKKVTVRYDGFIGADKERIHPTQKPVRLYEFLYTNYAKPGDRILDTHLGSGSSAIAAHNLGFDFVGIELDADYFAAAKQRLENHQKQPVMFDMPLEQKSEQGQLI